MGFEKRSGWTNCSAILSLRTSKVKRAERAMGTACPAIATADPTCASDSLDR